MIVSLIVAMDEQRGIGKNDDLPWHLPSDLQRFKRLTIGHYLVVGRKTYETIGKPLPGRKMVVVTHQLDYRAPGCQVVQSIDEALNVARDDDESEVFIIGGGDIFEQSVDIADKIYVTTVHADVHADVKFPYFNPDEWMVVGTDPLLHDNRDEYLSDFRILVRKKP